MSMTRFATLNGALQHTAAHCSTPQHTTTQCSTLQHNATHCNTLQHTATHCSTLQHTAAHCNTLQHTATQCSTLQHTTTHCNTLPHTCLGEVFRACHAPASHAARTATTNCTATPAPARELGAPATLPVGAGKCSQKSAV